MSVEAEDIGSILRNESAQVSTETTDVTAEPSSAAVEAPEAKEQPRAADGKFAKAEAVEAKPEAEKRATTPADVPAIIEERRKRQELQKQLEALKQQNPQKTPSVFEDEDAAFKARTSDLDQQWRERFYKQSVKLAQLSYKEAYTEAETAFMDAAERDPRLYEGLRSADDPGEYIYSLGLQIKELADVGGDFGKYKAKLTEGYKAQMSEKDARIAALEAQLAEATKVKQQLDSLPTSLNGKPTGQAKATDPDVDNIKSIARFGNQHR